MTIQKKLRAFALAAAMSLAAWGAYAETVTVSTYYPSPYGSYQLLDSSGQTHLSTGAGGTRIGNTANVTAGLELEVDGNAQVNGTFRSTGVLTGSALALNGTTPGTGTLAIANCVANVCYAQAVYS